MDMPLVILPEALVQSMWLIEGGFGLLLKPLLVDAYSYPD